MGENEIAKIVFEAGLKVHRALGPGLLESAYEACLCYELKKIGMEVETQVALPLVYEEIRLEAGYRIDLRIERKFIVEVKSVDALNDLHMAQILTYLKLSNCKLGLLINFNTVLFKDGVKRIYKWNIVTFVKDLCALSGKKIKNMIYEENKNNLLDIYRLVCSPHAFLRNPGCIMCT
jgi:GxxExxY protein